MSDPERPYISLGETERPFAEEHHDAVQLLVTNTLQKFTGTVLEAVKRACAAHERIAAEEVMERAYFTSLGGSLRLMGVGEAVACLGVSLQRIQVLRLYPDFPEPVARLLCGDIWLADDMEEYARTRNRRPGRRRKTKETDR